MIFFFPFSIKKVAIVEVLIVLWLCLKTKELISGKNTSGWGGCFQVFLINESPVCVSEHGNLFSEGPTRFWLS